MQVIFAGGASAVGASCLLVSIGGHWIVVDAGVRMDRAADPLPDLALLEGKEVKAILVTHAHSDHIGSLPIVHKAFPTVPIYTSRASGLLMEVMLTDALTVMERRAVEEMEIPLYPKDLVARMLNKLRPLPVGETLSLPELPGVTIHTSRAGHIAGAICLGLEADDGSVVISGDISCTPQRTVQGAVPPALPHPDLLILESTYGARLHPNRQMEEQRLAQAVADGIEHGGHVLIPAFGLGRSQEILLILQAAQEKGQIPPFQIFVDGLVRRVCDTYMLIPEALPPTLQRQIRRGYAPFRGPNVTFVRSPRERARVLAGPPAVIVSSSGMLSGGPSAWYAARLAGQEEASILITGYQDEEAPGRRLLSLVGQADGTLELDGQTVPVRCHVDKYALSAHADGHELASYAASLRPKQVALVHGDRDAREALQTLLVDTDVLLPENGTAIEGARTHKKQRGTKPMTTVAPLPALPQNIGQGAPLTLSDLQTLWQVIQAIPTLRIVTARELAGMWYEQASEEQIWQVLDTLAEDVDQRYFVRQAAMEEAYRVRVQGQAETTVNDLAQELVGQVLLLRLGAGNTKPALCQSLEGASIRVTLPKSVTFERTRFPFAAIIEVLGLADELPEALPTALALEELVKTARPLRTPLLAAGLARQCNSEASYTLGDLCSLAELSSRDLAARLAVAKVVYQHPGLFFQYRTCLDGDGLTLYRLMPDWQEALAQGDMQVYMAHGKNQQRILAILEQHLGSPPDLYKCSLDPETCNLRLAFLFPAVARQRYADAIAAAAEEAEVEITLAPRPQQVALVEAAHAALPTSLQVQGTASLFFDLETIRLTCTGSASAGETQAAQQQFLEKTGWKLELVRAVGSGPTQSPASQIGKTAVSSLPDNPTLSRLQQQQAIEVARQIIGDLDDLEKIGAQVATTTLLLRFHFPSVARRRYSEQFTQIEQETGWKIDLHPSIHEQALVDVATQLLPEGLTIPGAPSILRDRQTLKVRCDGSASAEVIMQAQNNFWQETDWFLDLHVPTLLPDTGLPERLTQQEVSNLAKELFGAVPGCSHIGIEAARSLVQLRFLFPDTARQRYAGEVAQLVAQSGWRVEIYPHTQQQALKDLARQLLPAEVQPTGNPSVYFLQRLLSLPCSGQMSEQAHAAIEQRFVEETGWQINLTGLSIYEESNSSPSERSLVKPPYIL